MTMDIQEKVNDVINSDVECQDSIFKGNNPTSSLKSKFDIQKIFEVRPLHNKPSPGCPTPLKSSSSSNRLAQRDSVEEGNRQFLLKLSSPSNQLNSSMDKKFQTVLRKSHREQSSYSKSPRIGSEISALRSKLVSPKNDLLHKKSGSFSGTISGIPKSAKKATPTFNYSRTLALISTKFNSSYNENTKSNPKIQSAKITPPSKSLVGKYKEMINSVYGLTNSQSNIGEAKLFNQSDSRLFRTFDNKCEKISAQTTATDPTIANCEPQALTSSSTDDVYQANQSIGKTEVSLSKAIGKAIASAYGK
jgi:hypothetical protein